MEPTELKTDGMNRAPHGYRSIQVTCRVDPKYSGQVIKFVTWYQVRFSVLIRGSSVIRLSENM